MAVGSLSARRAWIEISGGAFARPLAVWSLSARRAWIEMKRCRTMRNRRNVALRKESVDRNHVAKYHLILPLVALRKESVDRNPLSPLN